MRPKRQLVRYLGLSLWWAWAYVIFYSSSLYPADVPVECARQAWTVSLVGYVVTTVLCMVFARRIDPLTRRAGLLVSTSILACLGTALMAVSWRQGVVSPYVPLVIGGALTGLTSVLSLAWGELFGSLGMGQTGKLVTTSLFLGIVLNYLLVSLPTTVCIPIVTCLPAASVAMLLSSAARSPVTPVVVPSASYTPRTMPWRLVLNIGAVSMAFGFLQGAGIATSGDDGAPYLLFALVVLATGALAVYTNILGRELNVGLVYRATVVATLAGFMALPHLTGCPRLLAASVVTAAYDCFDIMAWVIMANIVALVTQAPMLVTFAWGRMSNHLGMLAGTLMGAAAASLQMQGVAVTAIAFVIVLCMVTALRDVQFFSTSPALVDRMSQDMPSLDEACGVVADTYGLTPRELEVLHLLARGRTAGYIADALVISDNTAKTHLKRIYRKLGVNSQQQLIDLVEGQRPA